MNADTPNKEGDRETLKKIITEVDILLDPDVDSAQIACSKEEIAKLFHDSLASHEAKVRESTIRDLYSRSDSMHIIPVRPLIEIYAREKGIDLSDLSPQEDI